MHLRTLGRWTLVLLSAWCVVAAFLWVDTAQGPLNIIQAIGLGAPAWMLAAPLLGAVGLACALRPRPGLYWLLFLTGIAQVPLAIAGVIALDEARLPAHWGPALNIPAALLWSLVATLMATGDAPPLDSPMARVAYLGRRKHLLALTRLAQQRGWAIRGPEPTNLALKVEGEWAGRPVHIESGAVYQLQLYATSYYYLTIAVRSPRNLWPMTLEVGLEGPKAGPRKAAVKVKCRNRKGRANTCYLWPPAGRPAESVDTEALKTALELGREFLRPRMAVCAAGESVWFGRQASFTMSETAQDVEAIIRWLDAIAGAMERNYSDARAPDNAGESSAPH